MSRTSTRSGAPTPSVTQSISAPSAPRRASQRISRRRCVRLTDAAPGGVMLHVTKSFSNDQDKWHPVVDIEARTVDCDCPDFTNRCVRHDPALDSPTVCLCKHVIAAILGDWRRGDLALSTQRVAELRAATQRKAGFSKAAPPLEDERRGEIYGEDGLPVLYPEGWETYSFPPEPRESAPSAPTAVPASLNVVEEVSLEEQVEDLNRRHFLRCNLDADHAERELLRAQVTQWQAEELDAYQCGTSCDWSEEIERAQKRIADLDDHLFFDDMFAGDEEDGR